MGGYPLGHMSSQFASVLIGEPEVDSVQDTDENNIDGYVRETVVSLSWLNAGEILHLEAPALSLLSVAIAMNPLHCVGLYVTCNSKP